MGKRLTEAQKTMREDISTISRESTIQRRTHEVITDITMESDLKLTPLEWAGVRRLLEDAIRAGRDLERDV